MSNPLKQFLITVLLVNSVVLGAQRLTLDTVLEDAYGSRTSLFENPSSALNRGRVIGKEGKGESLTFYVEVSELLNADKMKPRKKYKLDSFSWIGHPKGWWTGMNRKIRISNGDDTLVRTIPECHDENITIRQKSKEHAFTITKEDILEITIVNTENTDAHVEYFDAPPAPAKILGTAMNLLPNGNLPQGNGDDNKYNKYWRYNCPAVRICVTQTSPDWDVKRIGIISGGVLLLFFLFKPLFGRKKKKQR